MGREKETISVIRFLVKIIGEERDRQFDKQPFTIGKNGADYLLGQFLRQLWLPKESYYVSQNALEKWAEFGQNPEKIWNTFYKDKVVNASNNTVPVKLYKGAEKTERSDIVELRQNEYCYYRSVFHDDHITTIQSIKDRLCNLEAVNDDSILKILNSIKVAKILKEEDRKISRLKKDLPQNANDEQIKEYYNIKEVVLLNYNEWDKEQKGRTLPLE